MPDVVVVGAGGQLGHDLVAALASRDLVPLSHEELDLCDLDSTTKALGNLRPTTVINTAAYNRVDDAEDDLAPAFAVNAYAPRQLARICADLGCALIHISTDYVFGGDQRIPYAEDSPTIPVNAYGVSKLAGEYFVRTLCPKHFVVRTCGLYGVAGSRGKGGNFVETMIRMARERRTVRVVDDQVLTPTYTRDLAGAIAGLIDTRAYGVYHATNDGQCSWYEFASRTFGLLGFTPDFAPTTAAAYGAKARRPAYSVLSCERLRTLGIGPLRPWPVALEAYLQEKGHL